MVEIAYFLHYVHVITVEKGRGREGRGAEGRGDKERGSKGRREGEREKPGKLNPVWLTDHCL